MNKTDVQAPATAQDAHRFEWRIHANRLAPLIDGVEYFSAVRKALIHAQRQVFIVGWDLHSEIDLLRGEDAERAAADDDWPVRLADLLEQLVERRPKLHIRLLIWEGASMFVFERQHLPRMKRPWERHPRLRLVWDRDTPRLGAHHQKLVVIDDRVAFTGGMDLTHSRWDTHEHVVGDRRRRTPGLIPSTYSQPYHDAMLAFDGEAARTLGDWCRERWRRATGETIDRLDTKHSTPAPDPWPAEVPPLLADRMIELALTQPDYGGRPEKRQVEQAFLQQIATAERSIVIITQYLSCGTIVDALCDRLREPEGPEVVIVLPFGSPGALQSMSLDTRRDELIDRLRDADPGGRLGVYWPTLNAGRTKNVFKHAVYVHAKILIIDDRILRVGSANLNNRSMGLDTELDASIPVDDDDRDAIEAIARTRRRLLAYLLHIDPEEVEAAERRERSIVRMIESLRGGAKTLHPFDHHASKFAHNVALDIELADPSRPLNEIDAQRVLEVIAEQTGFRDRMRGLTNRLIGSSRRHRWLIALVGLLALIVIVLIFTAAPTMGVIVSGGIVVAAGFVANRLVGRRRAEDGDGTDDPQHGRS